MQKEHMYILGCPNFANYEASAALIKVPRSGGEIEYVIIGEDRLTRMKHTYMFPLRGIHYCLQTMGLDSLEQVDYLVTDYARLPRWLNSGPAYRKLEHDYLKVNLDFPRERIVIVDHHAAHAASAFYPSGFDAAAVLIVDGLGSELNTQSLFYMDRTGCREIERGSDWGIGRLYSMITGAVLPYGPEKGYGKVMGLAPYGADQPGPVLSFEAHDTGMTSDYSSFFSRYPISRLVAKDVQRWQDRQDVMSAYPARAAYDVQHECERQLVRMAHYAYEKTGSRKLCVSGGVALNGAANLRILAETPIEDIWIQPGCSDTGISFGLALWGYFDTVRSPDSPRVSVSMSNAYTGRTYAATAIDSLLAEVGIAHRATSPHDVAELLAAGQVVAWFEGGSELGPRALGHRSILADARDPKMKDHLNGAVKFREGYRPYAPSILLEHAADWLELERPSPFMLLLPRVRQDKQALVPAITHIDGTTRPQTVTAEDNGNYYRLIKAFYALTGVPLILNTSFNVNREPIVETPLDALICALSTAINYLYLDGRLIDCAPYQNPERVNRLITQRQQALDAEWTHITDTYLVRYDVPERDRYLAEENRIAEWYRDYRSKYELEKAMLDWQEHHRRILIVGTRLHTRCLYMYIPEFPSIEVVGFVAFDELPGEQAVFQVYPEMRLQDVPWHAVDEVLISTHEYQSLVAERAGALAGATPLLTIYDTACDSLIYVLPDRWPVMNPIETRHHQLVTERPVSITASNIDFDFQPALPSITDRYAVIINYHYCHPRDTAEFAGLNGITPDDLDQQLQVLSREFQFASVTELLNPDVQLPQSVAVITFDDGLKDFATYAAPILKRWNVPATVYCSTAPLMHDNLLDVHRIHLLQGKLGVQEFQQRFETRLLDVDDTYALDDPARLGISGLYPYDDEPTRKFKMLLNYQLPYSVCQSILHQLVEQVFGPEHDIVGRLYLSVDELRQLKNDGFDIGSHTHTHAILSRLDAQQQRSELTTTAHFFRDQLDLPVSHVAYPYGRLGTWNNDTKRLMKELGYQGGLTMARRIVRPQDVNARWEIPRFDVRDIFDANNDLQAEVIEVLFSGD